MKKIILLMAAVSCLAFTARAKNEAYIKTKEGKIREANEIESDASGNLSVRKGKFKTKIKKDDYVWAWIPKPKRIRYADYKFSKNDYKTALESYRMGLESYKYLGWAPYCMYKEGECLYKLDQNPEAIKKLQELQNYKLLIPEKNRQYVMEGLKLLAQIYIKTGKYSEANEVLKEVGKARDMEVAAFAYNARGDILAGKGQRKDAVLMYLRTILLFPQKVKYRAQALCRAANLMKEMNDKRYIEFANMLKKEYPDSPYVKELK